MSTATAPTDIGTMIWQMPCATGRRPCIAGTGMSVKNIASLYKAGHSPEDIMVMYDNLDLAQVYAALAYYHVNRAEIEEALALDDQAERDAIAEQRSKP